MLRKATIICVFFIFVLSILLKLNTSLYLFDDILYCFMPFIELYFFTP